MLRALYVWLLQLHPAGFRRHFGDEMLAIFDDARAAGCCALVADAAASLVRQWVFRPEFLLAPLTTDHPQPQPDGVPVFYTCGSEIPRRSALINGAFGAFAMFALVIFLVGHGGNRVGLLLGSHHPSLSNLLGVSSEATERPELDSEVHVAPDGALQARDELREFTAGYFRSLAVLGALDANHNLVLDAAEIEAAPKALRTLDADGDGNLSAWECGAQQAFLRDHPVLRALDADGDGRISGTEIDRAATLLKRLDLNYDRVLTRAEILPNPVRFHLAFLSQLDTDGDGRISQAEAAGGFGPRFANLLDAADRNHDGYVTMEELEAVLRRRADLNGDGAVTWEEMLAVRRTLN